MIDYLKELRRIIKSKIGKIAWIKCLKLMKYVYPSNKIAVVPYKGTYIYMDKGSRIEIGKGRLWLNVSWSKINPFTTLFGMGQNSKLVINGDYKIYSSARITINDNAILELGSGYINHGVSLSCFNRIIIGNKVYIGENVTIRDSDNHYISTSNRPISMPIVIEDNVWIGTNVIILKGVTIGKGAVVAAGSVVNKNVLANTLVAGVPVKVVKENIEWW